MSLFAAKTNLSASAASCEQRSVSFMFAEYLRVSRLLASAAKKKAYMVEMSP